MNQSNNGNVIALDIGTVRIGVAASDPTGIFAQGVSVLRAKDGWMEDLSKILDERGAAKIVVGMPRRTDGSYGPEAKHAEETVQRLRACFPGVEVVMWDERFTTVIANRALLEANVSRAGRKRAVDKVAAAVLLQNYLDFGESKNAVAHRGERSEG
ncbi:MAG: Holliday junction resolvase RuvX [Synergistaceae bacterium]|jgi:putative Holliday junction resolvase|nr:Holliday junction resolvase RuvX [Synergistaceae bacterium]